MSFRSDELPSLLTPQNVHYEAFRDTSLVLSDGGVELHSDSVGGRSAGENENFWSRARGVGFSQLGEQRFHRVRARTSLPGSGVPAFYAAGNKTIEHELRWGGKLGSAQSLRSRSPRFVTPRHEDGRDLVYDCSSAVNAVRPTQRNQTFRREKRHGSIMASFEKEAAARAVNTTGSWTMEKDFESWAWKSGSRSAWSAKGVTFGGRKNPTIPRQRRPKHSTDDDASGLNKARRASSLSASDRQRELELLSLMKNYWGGRMSRSELDIALRRAERRHRKEDRINGASRRKHSSSVEDKRLRQGIGLDDARGGSELHEGSSRRGARAAERTKTATAITTKAKQRTQEEQWGITVLETLKE